MPHASQVLRALGAVAVAVSLGGLRAPVAGAHPLDITVSYSGSGEYATTYHSQPPDAGGKHDTDYAHDSETERWSLRFTQPIRLGPRCASVDCTLSSATGHTVVRAQIFHRHHDGLYADLSSGIQCQLHSATAGSVASGAQLRYELFDGGRLLAMTALDPVANALLALPTACPGQGDSLDGLANNYLGPGFSFAPGWGPVPWFTSPTVIVPVAGLARAGQLRVPVRLTREGTAPRDCAAPYRWQSCRTGGGWSGTLTLSTGPTSRRSVS